MDGNFEAHLIRAGLRIAFSNQKYLTKEKNKKEKKRKKQNKASVGLFFSKKSLVGGWVGGGWVLKPVLGLLTVIKAIKLNKKTFVGRAAAWQSWLMRPWIILEIWVQTLM